MVELEIPDVGARWTAAIVIVGLLAVALLTVGGLPPGVEALGDDPQTGSPAQATATSGSDELSFATVDTGTHGSEVTLGLTAEGAIFVGGWDAVARSTDGGGNWSQLDPRSGFGYAADRVLVVDRETGRVFVDDTTLGCTILSWSDDLGETWTTNPVACGGGVTDHQKIAVGDRTELDDPTGELYDNVVYVCANGLTHTPCAASPDGGRTFGPGLPGQQLDGGSPLDSQAACAFQGTPVTGDDGTLYQPTTACGAQLWWSQDNAVSWTHSEVPVTPGEDTPDATVADDGTVYFAYSGPDWIPRLAASTDGGSAWGEAFSLAPDGLVSSAFTVVAGGSGGQVAFAYYGTFDDPTGWDHNPSTAPGGVTWHLFAGVVADADTDTPEIHREQVTGEPDPVERGCIGKFGGCLGNIADYIDVAVGPDGRAHVAYVDGCGGCSNAGESTREDVHVAIQQGGPTVGAE